MEYKHVPFTLTHVVNETNTKLQLSLPLYIDKVGYIFEYWCGILKLGNYNWQRFIIRIFQPDPGINFVFPVIYVLTHHYVDEKLQYF